MQANRRLQLPHSLEEDKRWAVHLLRQMSSAKSSRRLTRPLQVLLISIHSLKCSSALGLSIYYSGTSVDFHSLCILFYICNSPYKCHYRGSFHRVCDFRRYNTINSNQYQQPIHQAYTDGDANSESSLSIQTIQTKRGRKRTIYCCTKIRERREEKICT